MCIKVENVVIMRENKAYIFLNYILNLQIKKLLCGGLFCPNYPWFIVSKSCLIMKEKELSVLEVYKKKIKKLPKKML